MKNPVTSASRSLGPKSEAENPEFAGPDVTGAAGSRPGIFEHLQLGVWKPGMDLFQHKII